MGAILAVAVLSFAETPAADGGKMLHISYPAVVIPAMTNGENRPLQLFGGTQAQIGQQYETVLFLKEEKATTVVVDYKGALSYKGENQPRTYSENPPYMHCTLELPKWVISEYGGVTSDWTPSPKTPIRPAAIWPTHKTIVLQNPEEMPKGRIRNPGERMDLQGGTPELLSALKKEKLGNSARKMRSLDYLSDRTAWPTSEPVFSLYETALKREAARTPEEKAARVKDLWKFSLRPEFDKYGIDNMTRLKPSFSCVITTFQDALELLWSRKEGRPVKLSAAYLRWAHDQLSSDQREGADEVTMLKAIHKYGICEAKLMPWDASVPSPEALANGAQRKTLVARTVGVGWRKDPNKGEVNNVVTEPIMRLVVDELRAGHPVVAGGGAMGPKDMRNAVIRNENSDAQRRLNEFGPNLAGLPDGLPYEKENRGNTTGHCHLITGYYATLHHLDFGTAIPELNGSRTKDQAEHMYGYGYMLEFRESWTKKAGDQGHYFAPEWDYESQSYPCHFASLGLE